MACDQWEVFMAYNNDCVLLDALLQHFQLIRSGNDRAARNRIHLRDEDTIKERDRGGKRDE